MRRRGKSSSLLLLLALALVGLGCSDDERKQGALLDGVRSEDRVQLCSQVSSIEDAVRDRPAGLEQELRDLAADARRHGASELATIATRAADSQRSLLARSSLDDAESQRLLYRLQIDVLALGLECVG